MREGTWWTRLLDKAAKRLRDIYGEELLDAWTTAYKFHQKGFHEEQLTIEDIIEEAYKIEDLIKIVEKEAKKQHRSKNQLFELQKDNLVIN